MGSRLEEGFSKRDPELGELDIQLQVSFFVGEPSSEVLEKVRGQLALYDLRSQDPLTLVYVHYFGANDKLSTK